MTEAFKCGKQIWQMCMLICNSFSLNFIDTAKERMRNGPLHRCQLTEGT